jgi:hypothetical protein
MKFPKAFSLLALMMVLLLAACGESHEAMLRQLEMLEQMNRADSVMTNDSLAEALTTYFDSHGTANERLRAHYILGRTYADMGEAPAALNAYLDAADCADTTAADCDFHTLSRVYGQMSDVFYQQNLMEDYIEACDKSIKYAWKDRDTLQAMNEEALKMAAYNRLEQYDKVIVAFDEVYEELLQVYGIETAAKYCIFPINALIETGNADKAKYYIDILETKSGYFDKEGNVENGREAFYYYKGQYLLVTEQYDSAEYYFRKELQTGLDVTNQSMASRGLSLVFDKMGLPDSAAKYAIYSYEMNDSVYAQMATKEVERMSAAYQYNRFQKQAIENEKKAEHSRFLLLLFSALGVAVVFGLLLAFSVYRKRKQAQLFQYQRDLEHLERAQTKLQELRSEEQEHSLNTINSLSEEIATLQRRVAEYAKTSERRTTETSLMESDIVLRLREMLAQNPPAEASLADMRALKSLINEQLPMFYGTLNTESCTLNPIEYEVCLLIRVRFSPGDICKLLGRDGGYISNLRRRILQKVYGIDGKPKDLDDRILSIQ